MSVELEIEMEIELAIFSGNDRVECTGDHFSRCDLGTKPVLVGCRESFSRA